MATPTWTGDLDRHIAPDPARSALLIVDTQADFVEGGAMPIPGTGAALPAMVRLLAAYRRAGRPIVHIVRLYQGEDVDLPRRTLIDSGAMVARPGTPGSQIAPELRPPGAADLDAPRLLAGGLQELGPGETVVWKPRWSAFFRTPLHRHLAGLGVNTVVVAGCNFPNCPRATVYDASEHDYRVVLASDAISGIAPYHLEEAGRIGVVHADAATIADRLSATVRQGVSG